MSRERERERESLHVYSVCFVFEYDCLSVLLHVTMVIEVTREKPMMVNHTPLHRKSRWLSGRGADLRSRDAGFESIHYAECDVSFSKIHVRPVDTFGSFKVDVFTEKKLIRGITNDQIQKHSLVVILCVSGR